MLPTRTWPWMPLPSGPIRSGILSAPAARITGVASRNANLAASSRDRPRNMPATIVTPSRLMPANRARIWTDPITRAWPGPITASRRSDGSKREFALGGDAPVGPPRRPPEPLPGEQDQPVHAQEHRGVDRLAEDHPERVLEDQ